MLGVGNIGGIGDSERRPRRALATLGVGDGVRRQRSQASGMSGVLSVTSRQVSATSGVDNIGCRQCRASVPSGVGDVLGVADNVGRRRRRAPAMSVAWVTSGVGDFNGVGDVRCRGLRASATLGVGDVGCWRHALGVGNVGCQRRLVSAMSPASV